MRCTAVFDGSAGVLRPSDEKGTRCDRPKSGVKSAAAPATVSGEALRICHWVTGKAREASDPRARRPAGFMLNSKAVGWMAGGRYDRDTLLRAVHAKDRRRSWDGGISRIFLRFLSR